MPLPLVVWIAGAVVTLFVGATIVFKDELLVMFKGKRLAVLGARGVGKSHLVQFLAKGSIPAEYKQQWGAKKRATAGRRFELRELDLKIKELFDTTGDKGAHGEWKLLFDEADVVFYLLRADQVIIGNAEVETRVRDDLRQIEDWLSKRQERPMFFIVGTHCDLDPEFTHLTDDKSGDYYDKFCSLPIVRELVARGGGTQQAKVGLGSMKTKESTEDLVHQLFTQVLA